MNAVLHLLEAPHQSIAAGAFAKRRLSRATQAKPKAIRGPSARFNSESYAAALAEATATGLVKQIPVGQSSVGAGKWPWPPAFVPE